MADRLAKEATDPTMPIDHHITPGEVVHADQAWPSLQETTPQPDLAPNPPTPQWKQATNLTSHIKTVLPTSTHTGYAKTTGTYATMWNKALPHLHKPTSSRYWNNPNITWPQRTNILRMRWGNFWNRKLAHRYNLKYANNPHPTHDANCPICHCNIDGASHILAGCPDPQMKGFYINRHNRAVQTIQKAISKASLGNTYTIMDACKQEDLPPDVRDKDSQILSGHPTSHNKTGTNSGQTS